MVLRMRFFICLLDLNNEIIICLVRSVSGCVKNSFRQERIGHQQLEVRHGIVHSSFLHHDLCHVQRCE